MNFHQSPYTYTGEVYLKVTDLDKSKAFYTNIIGFKVLGEDQQRVLFTADGKTPLLIIEQPENVTPKESGTTGLYHFALLLPERADLGKIIKHFVAHKVALGAADHLVSEALYLSDPDGNGIEIYVDRKPELWTWENEKVEMATDPLDAESIVAESEGLEWDGLPAGTIMGHIHLHVADLQESETFYNALGLEVVSHYPQALFMANGKYHHHLGLNTWHRGGDNQPSDNSAGLRAFTLVFPTVAELQKAIHQVESLGNLVESTNEGYFTKDPSGNGIVLRVE